MALGPDELRRLAMSDLDVAEILDSSLGARQIYIDSLRAMGRLPSIIITTANSSQEIVYISDSNQIPLPTRGTNVESWLPSPSSK
jgi:hypothetical protein